ncbi:hypothetical protein P691DRAFT_680337, partial [Macrolepiota fuliginosa MF-IS2]
SSLESYTHNLSNSIIDDGLSGEFDPTDKTKLETTINEAISWLGSSQEAFREEYDEKRKELEDTDCR